MDKEVKSGFEKVPKQGPESLQHSTESNISLQSRVKAVTAATTNVMAKMAEIQANRASDKVLCDLLQALKATDDPIEIKKLSFEIERVIFHKQYKEA